MGARARQGQEGSGRWLAIAAVAAAAIGLAAAWLVAQPPSGLDQYSRLGGEIGCTCGTCPLRPILTCGCGFADTMLAELRQMVDEGNDDDAIMTAFAANYGESIRIAPHGSGFDLAVWAAPMLFLTLGAVAIAAIIVRWVRRPASQAAALEAAPAAVAGATVTAGDVVDPQLRARVEAELADLES